MEEQLLLEIKIDKPQTEAEIDKLTESIEALKKSNADLAKQQTDLKKAGEENSKAYLENAKQIELNRYEINKNSAERKNLINATAPTCFILFSKRSAPSPELLK